MNFVWSDYAKAYFIDGKLRALTAGYRVPNSETFYPVININDYSIPTIGEFVAINDFSNIKKLGYKQFNFGGSDKRLLAFKKKFKPKKIYKTHFFSIIKK